MSVKSFFPPTPISWNFYVLESTTEPDVTGNAYSNRKYFDLQINKCLVFKCPFTRVWHFYVLANIPSFYPGNDNVN